MIGFYQLFAVSLVVCCSQVQSLSCPPCSRDLCDPVNPCKFGTGTDSCGCCPVCKKGPGQTCGGPWAIMGYCGFGLICRREETYRPSFMAPGICEDVFSILDSSDDEMGGSLPAPRSHLHNNYRGIPRHILATLQAIGVIRDNPPVEATALG